jgi:hypothetical protein
MVPQFVARRDDVLRLKRVSFQGLPCHKEGRSGFFLTEDLENLFCEAWPRSIVKGERYDGPGSFHVCHHFAEQLNLA